MSATLTISGDKPPVGQPLPSLVEKGTTAEATPLAAQQLSAEKQSDHHTDTVHAVPPLNKVRILVVGNPGVGKCAPLLPP